ncbi:hypothetical protein SAY87_008432 [Trapa incisa]|uniref:Snakin-1 n=2 Tax=Trapa TaxID=22665 RepID=A0AAN7L0S5_TRANT|nr:hypothetical protein SAY87_008432 [Trapa incisa]KAK4777222.1 hypothetical protein SAY86_005910 [Trapa natans]
MKLVPAALLFVSLVLFVVSTADYLPPAASPPSLCDTKCETRCSNAGMKDRCLKYCGICCNLCKCVPSGTYGNKSECPCYRDMKNSKGKSKCP